ncbi:MAG TPA: hypothetical protein VFH39_01135 [Candidatus Saccharimonadales bacterium]|nr:hypothetical protein [Candidatus Saccharimonadales bacterium]
MSAPHNPNGTTVWTPDGGRWSDGTPVGPKHMLDAARVEEIELDEAARELTAMGNNRTPAPNATTIVQLASGWPTETATSAERKQYPLPDLGRLPKEGRPGKRVRRLLESIDRTQEDPQNPGFALVPQAVRDSIPAPTLEEQARWDAEDYRRRTEALIDYTGLLAKQKRGAKVLFLGEIGGSGTTTFCTHLAASLRVDTQADTLVYDANHSMGSVAKRFGFYGSDTLTQQQLSELRLWYGADKQNFSDDTPNHTRLGVRVVASSRIWDGERLLFRANDCSECLKIMSSNTKFLFIDAMNDFTHEVGRRLLSEVDLIVFTASTRKEDSLWSLWPMMDLVRELGFEELVKRSIVGITGYPAGTNLKAAYGAFLKHRELRKQGGREVVQEFKNDRVYDVPMIGIPHDPHVESERIDPIDRLQLATREAIREGVIAVLQKLPDRRQLTRQQVLAWVQQQRSAHPGQLQPTGLQRGLEPVAQANGH